VRKRAALIVAGTAAMLAAAATPSGHEAAVGRAIFELCPQVLDGALRLDDPAALAAIGYRATAPRQTESGPDPRAEYGEGPSKIVISGGKKADHGTCGVWFGGPDNKPLFKAMRKKAQSSGFEGGGRPAQLGDGIDIYSFRQSGSSRRSIIFIAGPAGDGIGAYPTTTAIMMDGKGE
jgi:hypothetical protein